MSDEKPFALVVRRGGDEPLARWDLYVAGENPLRIALLRNAEAFAARINAAVEAREATLRQAAARAVVEIARATYAIEDGRRVCFRCGAMQHDYPGGHAGGCAVEEALNCALEFIDAKAVDVVDGQRACGLAFDLGVLQAKFEGTWGVLADKLHETNGAIDGQAAALLDALGIVSWEGLWRTLNQADLEGPLTMTGIDIRENSHGPLAPRLQWLDAAGEWHELGADNDGLVRPPPEAVQVRSVYRSRLQGDAIMPPSAPAEAAPRRPPSRRRKSAR